MSFIVKPGGRVAGPPVNGMAGGITSLQSVSYGKVCELVSLNAAVMPAASYLVLVLTQERDLEDTLAEGLSHSSLFVYN